VLVVHTPDELTKETLPVLQGVLEDNLESGLNHVVLQMGHSEGFDSVGLTALVDL